MTHLPHSKKSGHKAANKRAPKKYRRTFWEEEPQASKRTGRVTTRPVANLALRRREGEGVYTDINDRARDTQKGREMRPYTLSGRFFGKKEPQALKQTGQETSCPVATCAMRKKQGSQKVSKTFLGKGAAGAKANRTGHYPSCCKKRLAATLAEGEGFEPPDRCRSSVFKTDAIDHSANLPYRRLLYQKCGKVSTVSAR